jgi:hypothetical protein
MRDVLIDLLKQTSGLVDVLRVLGSADETTIKACDKDKAFFIEARLKKAIPEFNGEFAIANMSLLNGLLNFSNYCTDDATFNVKTVKRDERSIIDQFEFSNKVTGNQAVFRLMDPKLAPEQATIANIPWDVEFTPSKSKLTEFAQLANLYANIDPQFGVRTVDGNLEFYIGDDDSASHRASMIFETGVTGDIRGSVKFNVQHLLSAVKLSGSNPVKFSITGRGVFSVSVETPHGNYTYFLRASR